MIIVVRDEEEFLRENLLYHRSLGVAGAYVFLDHSTDRSLEIARSLPWVRVEERPRERGTHVTDLLRTCVRETLGRARADGFDWLLSIDADEFAAAGAPGADWRGRVRRRSPEDDPHLTRMLERVGPEVEIVRLTTRELVPRRGRRPHRFWEQVLFQRGAGVRRRIRDAAEGRRRLVRWFGHQEGKTIVRTTAEVEPVTAHDWRPAASRGGAGVLREQPGGWVYHYALTSPDHWLRKYRAIADSPDFWPSGAPQRFPKIAWKRLAAELPEPEAAAYFERVIALAGWRILAARLLGQVTVDHTVREAVGGVVNHQ